MWKNDSPESPITPRDPRVPGVAQQHLRGRHKKWSVVGSTLTIKGEVSGGEDLLAKTIQVDGCVEGNLQGEEWIRLSETGGVRGKLIAPRVILEEGCDFKGTIDMDASAESSR